MSPHCPPRPAQRPVDFRRAARGARPGSPLWSLLERTDRRFSRATYERRMRLFQERLEKSSTKSMALLMADLAERAVAATKAAGGLEVAEARVEPTHMEKARVNAIVKAMDLERWRKDKILPWLDKLYRSAWVGAYSLAQSTLTSTQRDAAIRRVLAEGGRRLGLVDLAPDVKAAMFRVIEFSREWEAGQPSPIQVARWIRAEIPAGRFVHAGPVYRAKLIARTEVMHSTRFASLETFRVDPTVGKVYAIDGDFDDYCAARNGQEYTIDDAELEMNSVETHPNCTLMFAPAYQDR